MEKQIKSIQATFHVYIYSNYVGQLDFLRFEWLNCLNLPTL